MLRSFLRSLSVAMLIIGTVIGAGFASGKEVVAFFGSEPNVLTSAVSGVLVFLCSTLFLFVGKRVKKDELGEVNSEVFGRARPIADVFMLFNSLTLLGAMLAGTDSLAAELVDIRPFASVAAGVLCALIAVRGLSGVIKANAALVPVMIVFLAVCSLSVMEIPLKTQSSPVNIGSAALYVSMNMILGGGVLTTVHKLSSREILLSSAIAAAVIGGLLFCIMGALGSCSAAYADMPTLLIALKSGRVMYFVCLPVIAFSIFTTMLAAFKAVYDYILGFIGSRAMAAGLVLCAGLAVGAFGFSNVVGKLYPITGALGFIYIATNVLYLAYPNIRRIKTLHDKREQKGSGAQVDPRSRTGKICNDTRHSV